MFLKKGNKKHKERFLSIYFWKTKTVEQVSKIDKILLLGTEVAFCYCFMITNKDHLDPFCITLYEHQKALVIKRTIKKIK